MTLAHMKDTVRQPGLSVLQVLVEVTAHALKGPRNLSDQSPSYFIVHCQLTSMQLVCGNSLTCSFAGQFRMGSLGSVVCLWAREGWEATSSREGTGPHADASAVSITIWEYEAPRLCRKLCHGGLQPLLWTQD